MPWIALRYLLFFVILPRKFIQYKMADNHTLTSQTENSGNRLNEQLYNDVCGIIEDARHRVATYVNSEVCMMNGTLVNASKKMSFAISVPITGSKS